jgi:hypothetical protein
MKKIIFVWLGIVCVGCLLIAAATQSPAPSTQESAIRDEMAVYKDMGRRLSFLMQDLVDDIQAFIRKRGIVSLQDPMSTQEGIMMQLLAEKRLEARINVRLAESDFAMAKGEDAIASATIRLEGAKQYLLILDAELELLDVSLREQVANVMVLEHMMRKLNTFEKRADENERIIDTLMIESVLNRTIKSEK